MFESNWEYVTTMVVRILSLTLRVLCLFLCRLMSRALTVGHHVWRLLPFPWKGQCGLLNVLGFHNNMNMHRFTSLLLYYIPMFTNSLGEFFPFSLVHVHCSPIHKLMGELHHHLSIILDGWHPWQQLSAQLCFTIACGRIWILKKKGPAHADVVVQEAK